MRKEGETNYTVTNEYDKRDKSEESANDANADEA